MINKLLKHKQECWYLTIVGEKVSRRNGGFLELLSLLLVYGIVSRFIQIKRTDGILLPIEADYVIGMIV